MRRAWEKVMTPARAEKLLEEALESEKTVSITCPQCGKFKTALTRLPDWQTRKATAELFLTQGLGRPPEGEKRPPRPDVSDIAGMSDEELQAWVDAADDDYQAQGPLGTSEAGTGPPTGQEGPFVAGVADGGGGPA